jgi:lipoyl-dependent peroxiredoxin
MPTRGATAVWKGGLADTGGSNPEELLAAAEASCFSMALGLGLEKEGFPATEVETRAACTVEKVGEGFNITHMKLTVRATVPGIDAAKFQAIASATKEGCPVSQALKGNVRIDLDAVLA